MTMIGDTRRAEGVGVTYHPFLHDFLLDRVELFDFFELPLDLYIDTARSALLDPGLERLQQIIAAKPCAWCGSALALGSVEAGFPRYALQSVRRLLAMTPGATYTEAIGFRVAGHGARHAMPFTPAAALWIAQRQAEAQHTLTIPVQLSLPHRTAAAETGLDAIDFLARISAHGGTGFVVDASDADPAWPDDGALPADRIAAVSVSSDDVATWDRLSALAARLQPRTIVLRRDRQLFPLDTIERDLRRAKLLIVAPTHADTAPSTTPPVSDVFEPDSLAALLNYQHTIAAAFDPAKPRPSFGADAGAVAAGSWQNWRNQVDDMHKAQQIAALLSRGPGRPWRA